jgi:segregation and condensation protein B
MSTNNNQEYLSGLIEAVIYISEEPVTPEQLAKICGEKEKEVKIVLTELLKKYNLTPGGLRIVETGGGYRFETDPIFGPILKDYFIGKGSGKLSRAAMETLAIIAYKQPVTVPEINDIRTVDSSGTIHKLLEKKLVKIVGRKDVIGKPLIYATTPLFLARFGLNSLDELPAFDEFVEIMDLNSEKINIKTEFEEHLKPGPKSQEDDLLNFSENDN